MLSAVSLNLSLVEDVNKEIANFIRDFDSIHSFFEAEEVNGVESLSHILKGDPNFVIIFPGMFDHIVNRVYRYLSR